MIKWFAYIVLLLIFAPGLSSAKIKSTNYKPVIGHAVQPGMVTKLVTDSLAKKRQQQEDDKKKVKEVSKAKRQSKPEKVDEAEDVQGHDKPKPKRERRPEGMERPPEIPRRNGN